MLVLGSVKLLSYCVNNVEQNNNIKSFIIKQEDKDLDNIKYGIDITYNTDEQEYITFVLNKNIYKNIFKSNIWMFMFLNIKGGIYSDLDVIYKYSLFYNSIKLKFEYKDNKTLEYYERIIKWKNKRK